jgi:methyl-accepting chemotaxis protein
MRSTLQSQRGMGAASWWQCVPRGGHKCGEKMDSTMKVLNWFRAQAKHAAPLATCITVQEYIATQGKDADSDIHFPEAFPNTITEAERAEANVAGLDFIDAITAHQRWKNRLRQYLDDRSTERLDYRTACRDDQCVLGKWLHGSGRTAHGHRTIFGDLIKAHADFHLAAGDVIKLKDNMQTDAAKDAMWSGPFALKSAAVQSLISALFMELREPEPSVHH